MAAFGGAVRALRQLGWPYRVLALARYLPPRLADKVYDAVAGNRYRLFGATTAPVCRAPTSRALSAQAAGTAGLSFTLLYHPTA